MTLVLIDLSSIYWSSWHASVNEAVSTACNNAVSRVRDLVSRYEKAAICCDSPKSWRKDLAPTYKANRPEKDAQAISELRRCEETLVKDGMLLWRADGYEADDVIATATWDAPKDWEIVIATADKDLCQLVSERVKIYNLRSGELMGPAEVKTKHGVTPGQMRDYLTLIGDSSDNVEGVKGIGPKTASALLERFGTLDGIFNALDDTPELFTKPAIKAALTSSGEIVNLGQRLIELVRAPIEFKEIFEERKQQPLQESEVADIDDGDKSIDENPAFAEFVEPKKEELKINKTEPPKDAKNAEIAVTTQPQSLARVSFEMSLEPTTIGAAYKLATGLANSRLYSRFPNAEAIWAIIIRGREMGLGALTALDSFHIVEGKPVCHAHLIIARAKADSDCEYFQMISSDDNSATYETKHRDDPNPTRLTYTAQQAEAAGLLSKPGGNWHKRRAEMLRKTCGVQLARIVYPGAAMGLYSTEEMGVDV